MSLSFLGGRGEGVDESGGCMGVCHKPGSFPSEGSRICMKAFQELRESGSLDKSKESSNFIDTLRLLPLS